jgi:hypothetical protein
VAISSKSSSASAGPEKENCDEGEEITADDGGFLKRVGKKTANDKKISLLDT